METVEFHNTEFTFERVERINELPTLHYRIIAPTHEAALRYHLLGYSRHVLYYEQKSTGGRIYAFTKGE